MGPEAADTLRDAGIAHDWLLAACPDALWVVDMDGRTLYANEQTARLLGVEPVAMTTLRLQDALTPAALERLGSGDSRALAAVPGEPVPEGTYELFRPDGTSTVVQIGRRAVVDAEGRARGWLHRATACPRHAQIRPDLVTLGTRPIGGVGAFDWDMLTGRLVWSQELFRIAGLDSARFTPSYDAFLALLHPDDRGRAEATLETALATPETVSVDLRFLPEGGAQRWLRLRGQAERTPGGSPVRVRGIVQDITETKETESTLTFLSWMGRAANEARTLQDVLAVAEHRLRPHSKWRPVLVSVPDGPHGSDDPDGPALIHLDLDLAPATDASCRAARALAEQVARERRLSQVVGPEDTILVAGAVTVGERLACVLVDETGTLDEPSRIDLVVFEQVLGMLARVAEREWAAQELALAHDEALRASRAKSEFLTTMSHEIRTPLNGVIGLSELLSHTDLTDHQRRLTRELELAGRILLGLVNDVLDLSKIEAGHLELEQTDFDPRAVVEGSVSLVAERARQKGLELAVSIVDLPARLRGDPFRLGQVISNLVSNAVKFTQTGEVLVRARADDTPAGPGVRVEVRDTGIGISAVTRAKLFRPFSQADTSTTREYGGTGLGLAISQRIVHALGGEIGVRSEPGSGSTFWFTAAFDPPQDAGPEPAPDVTGLRVLIAHHSPTVREILVAQLADALAVPARVSCATGAWLAGTTAELTAAADRGTPYDVLLLDHHAPELDGIELARAVRQDVRHDATRLVLLSATAPSPQTLAGAGIQAVVGKPVLRSMLLDAVAAVATGGTRAAATAPRPKAARTPSAGRILVVEDNAVNQLVAEGLLEQLGYEVVLADNGAAGVSALAHDDHGFDAVLMDCQMPVLDGYDATRAIRTLHADRSRVPIIAMTAAVVAHEREQCLAAGMDDFLSKPVDPDALRDTLARWVTAARGEPPAVDAEAVEVVDSFSPEEFDRARLDLLLEGGKEAQALVLRILERFTSGAAESTRELQDAARRADAARVRHLAHRLRGSAANIGLVRVAEQCEVIELDAELDRLPSPDACLALDLTVSRGVRALAAYAREFD